MTPALANLSSALETTTPAAKAPALPGAGATPKPNAEPNAEPDARAALVARLRSAMRPPASPRGDAGAPAPSPLGRLLGPPGVGRLVDLLASGAGSGAGLVGLWLCVQACAGGGELVVINPPDRSPKGHSPGDAAEGSFYPPAAIAWGVDARRLLWVRPESPSAAVAAAELALRSPAVGAVWASLGRIDARAGRRLLLAAEAGRALGVLVRPSRFAADPSWADVQLGVAGDPSPHAPDAPLAVLLTRLRNRHGPAGGCTALRLDWRAGTVG